MEGDDTTGIDTSAVGGAGAGLLPASPPEFRHTSINGRLNQYTSSYWALALPALSVRYAFEAASSIATKIMEKHKLPQHFSDKAERGHAIGVGAFMLGVTGYYSHRTYQDMRNLFAQPLAWEFGKKEQDVGWDDIMHSQNLLVQQARDNFMNYNTRRFGVNAVFLGGLLPRHILKPDNAVKLGIAANALYLMRDVLFRKETFFERLQSFIDDKINHADRVGDLITAGDLMSLYYRHSKDKNENFVPPHMNTQAWKRDEALFARMADLMNQTYGNTPVKEHADFTITKFLYLVGMGLLSSENPEKNVTYVEMANNQGIPAVKQAALSQEPERFYLEKEAEREAPAAVSRGPETRMTPAHVNSLVGDPALSQAAVI